MKVNFSLLKLRTNLKTLLFLYCSGSVVKCVEKVSNVVIFFGGDCQNFCALMAKHNRCFRYANWSLESTCSILSKKFPESHIFVVRPSIIRDSIFACYQNFVESDGYGIPTFQPNHGAWRHLKELMTNVLQQLMKVRWV